MAETPEVSASDFRQGERVLSPAGCPGKVIARQRGTLTVEYNDKGAWTVSYTPKWFKRYGYLLRKVGGQPRT